jgi:AcrR family transcriptional regulator
VVATTRAVSTASRRQAILDAALHCFTESGYAATNVEDIRDRSGASIGSIYHHFGGKEQIAAALYLEALCRYQEGFIAELGAHRDPEAGVKAVVRYHLHWVAEHGALARFFLTHRPPEVRMASQGVTDDLNHDFFARIAEWFVPHMKAGRIRKLPTDLLTAVLVAPAHYFSLLWTSGQSETRIERASAALADAAWQALGMGGE